MRVKVQIVWWHNSMNGHFKLMIFLVTSKIIIILLRKKRRTIIFL